MNTDEIIKHLKQQDSNIEFYKEKINRLEKQIEDIKHISTIANTTEITLRKTEYTREEIISAYNKMLKYEGIEHREGSLITNTMFDFLDGKHHSPYEVICNCGKKYYEHYEPPKRYINVCDDCLPF